MTDTESALVQLWRESLETENIGIDQDFFDLGGDSLKAFMLLVKIEQRFAKSLGFGKRLEPNTIRRQAAFLDHSKSTADNVDIRPLLLKGDPDDETRPSLFLVHGTVTDELGCYLHLVENLPDGFRVHGLQSNGQITGTDFETIEEMARQHVRAIRSVQASGPYYLGGFCFGGLIAYEIAQQLLAIGETVRFLLVFDYAMNYAEKFRFPRTARQILDFLSNTRIAVQDFIETRKERKGLFREAMLWLRRAIIMSSKNSMNGAPSTGFWHSVSLAPAERDRSLTQFRAFRKYKPRPYPGEVILFRPRRLPLLQPYDTSLGWNQLCPGRVTVKIVDGPGWHGSILQTDLAQSTADEIVRLLPLAGAQSIPVPPCRPAPRPVSMAALEN